MWTGDIFRPGGKGRRRGKDRKPLKTRSLQIEPLEILELLAIVSIFANDSTATEEGPKTGQFTVTCTETPASDLVVNYTVGGDADYYMNPEYTGLPNHDGMGSGWVTIPAGSFSVVITITPVNDNAPVFTSLATASVVEGATAVLSPGR